MNTLISLDHLFHRSKDRVRDLGEVFTPEAYVEQMMAVLSRDNRSLWSDESITFFEPTCGHGNIVIPVIRKRIASIYKKALSSNMADASLYAVANAINTTWAIDIDPKNVEHCRQRVFEAVIAFLVEKSGAENEKKFLSKNRDFLAHVLCAVRWHICENEALSCLVSAEEAKIRGKLTKAGSSWLSRNQHKKLEFDKTWCRHFAQSEENKTIPLDYERAQRFLGNLLSGSARGFSEFEFAKDILSKGQSTEKISTPRRDAAMEA